MAFSMAASARTSRGVLGAAAARPVVCGGATRALPRRATRAAAARHTAWTGLNAGPQPVAAPAPAQRFSSGSLLPLISSSVQASAQLASFESLAGRSAMVGFLVALLLEWGTERSTFTPLTGDQAAALAAALGVALLAATAAAAAAARPGAGAAADGLVAGRPWWWLGARIHEAVMSSLTSTRRSASSVTQLRVDDAVDFVLDRAFDASVHPVFAPLRGAGETLRGAGEAAATVTTVMDSLLSADDRPEPPH